MPVLRQVSRELGRIGQERVDAVPGLRQQGRGSHAREQLDVLNPTESGGRRPPHVIPDGRRADDWDSRDFRVSALTPQLMRGGWTYVDWVLLRLQDGAHTWDNLQSIRPPNMTAAGVVRTVRSLVQEGRVVAHRGPSGGVERFHLAPPTERALTVIPSAAQAVKFIIHHVVQEPGHTQASILALARSTHGDHGGGIELRFEGAVKHLLQSGTLRESAGILVLWSEPVDDEPDKTALDHILADP